MKGNFEGSESPLVQASGAFLVFPDLRPPAGIGRSRAVAIAHDRYNDAVFDAFG